MSSVSRRSDDDSRGPDPDRTAPRGAWLVHPALAICALAGVASLVAATLLPVLRVEVGGSIRAALDQSGWDLHGPALIVLAVVAAVLLPAALRGSLVAALGIALTGVAALGIAVIGDLPDVGSTGPTALRLQEGTGRAGIGAYAEVLGAVLLLTAGGALALLRGED